MVSSVQPRRELARRTAELGYPISRGATAKIESEVRSGKIDVAEVLVLAAALDIPPVLLLFPQFSTDGGAVVVPGVMASEDEAVRWMSGQVSFPHRSTTCRAPAWRASPIRRTTELTSQPWLHEKRWRRSPAGIGYSSVVPGALLSSCACARDESTQRYVDVRDRRPCNRDPSSESPRLSVATPDSAASRTAADRAGARRPSCSMTSSTARPARHPIRRSGRCRQTGRRSKTPWGSTDPSFGDSTATVGKTCSSTANPISFCAPPKMATRTSAA
jgi:hypothetical protein